MSRKNHLIEFSFVLITMLAAWNVQLDAVAERLTSLLGFEKTSFGHAAIVDAVVPSAVATIAAGAQFSYRRWVWRLLPGSGYSAGVWIYMLIAFVDDAELSIAGWFRLKHDSEEMRVDEARAYYLEPGELVFRGEWTSDTIWLKNRELGIMFTMSAEGIEREPMPSQYNGMIQLRLRPAAKRADGLVWTGHFYDLGDRTGIHGPIAAKRLVKSSYRQDPDDIIGDHIKGLQTLVHQMMGRDRIRYSSDLSRDAPE